MGGENGTSSWPSLSDTDGSESGITVTEETRSDDDSTSGSTVSLGERPKHAGGARKIDETEATATSKYAAARPSAAASSVAPPLWSSDIPITPTIDKTKAKSIPKDSLTTDTAKIMEHDDKLEAAPVPPSASPAPKRLLSRPKPAMIPPKPKVPTMNTKNTKTPEQRKSKTLPPNGRITIDAVNEKAAKGCAVTTPAASSPVTPSPGFGAQGKHPSDVFPKKTKKTPLGRKDNISADTSGLVELKSGPNCRLVAGGAVHKKASAGTADVPAAGSPIWGFVATKDAMLTPVMRPFAKQAKIKKLSDTTADVEKGLSRENNQTPFNPGLVVSALSRGDFSGSADKSAANDADAALVSSPVISTANQPEIDRLPPGNKNADAVKIKSKSFPSSGSLTSSRGEEKSGSKNNTAKGASPADDPAPIYCAAAVDDSGHKVCASRLKGSVIEPDGNAKMRKKDQMKEPPTSSGAPMTPEKEANKTASDIASPGEKPPEPKQPFKALTATARTARTLEYPDATDTPKAGEKIHDEKIQGAHGEPETCDPPKGEQSSPTAPPPSKAGTQEQSPRVCHELAATVLMLALERVNQSKQAVVAGNNKAEPVHATPPFTTHATAKPVLPTPSGTHTPDPQSIGNKADTGSRETEGKADGTEEKRESGMGPVSQSSAIATLQRVREIVCWATQLGLRKPHMESAPQDTQPGEGKRKVPDTVEAGNMPTAKSHRPAATSIEGGVAAVEQRNGNVRAPSLSADPNKSKEKTGVAQGKVGMCAELTGAAMNPLSASAVCEQRHESGREYGILMEKYEEPKEKHEMKKGLEISTGMNMKQGSPSLAITGKLSEGAVEAQGITEETGSLPENGVGNFPPSVMPQHRQECQSCMNRLEMEEMMRKMVGEMIEEKVQPRKGKRRLSGSADEGLMPLAKFYKLSSGKPAIIPMSIPQTREASTQTSPDNTNSKEIVKGSANGDDAKMQKPHNGGANRTPHSATEVDANAGGAASACPVDGYWMVCGSCKKWHKLSPATSAQYTATLFRCVKCVRCH